MVRVGLLKVFDRKNDDNRCLLKEDDDLSASCLFPDEGAYAPPEGLADYTTKDSIPVIEEETEIEAATAETAGSMDGMDHSSQLKNNNSTSSNDNNNNQSNLVNSPIRTKPDSYSKEKLSSPRRSGQKKSSGNDSSPKSPAKKKQQSNNNDAPVHATKDAFITTESGHGQNDFLQFSLDPNVFQGNAPSALISSSKKDAAISSGSSSSKSAKKNASDAENVEDNNLLGSASSHSTSRKSKRRTSSKRRSSSAGLNVKEESKGNNGMKREDSSLENLNETLDNTELERQNSSAELVSPTKSRRSKRRDLFSRSKSSDALPIRGMLKAPSFSEEDTRDSEGKETGKESEGIKKRSGKRSKSDFIGVITEEETPIENADEEKAKGISKTGRRTPKTSKSMDQLEFALSPSQGGENTNSPVVRSRKKGNIRDPNEMTPLSAATRRRSRILKKSDGDGEANDMTVNPALLLALSLDMNPDDEENLKEEDSRRRASRRCSTGELSATCENTEEEEDKKEESNEKKESKNSTPKRGMVRRSSTGSLSAMAVEKVLAPKVDDFLSPLASSKKKRAVRRSATGDGMTMLAKSSTEAAASVNSQQVELLNSLRREKNGTRKRDFRAARRRRSLSDFASDLRPKTLPNNHGTMEEDERELMPTLNLDSPVRIETQRPLYGRSHSDKSLTVEEASPVRQPKTNVSNDLDASKVAIESAMTMLEEDVDTIKEIPFVSLSLSKQSGKAGGDSAPPTPRPPSPGSSELGNMQLISKLREELVESNMLLNHSRLETVKLQDEVRELKAQLEELRKK